MTSSIKGKPARQIISERLGRDLGPLATMPRDIRKAVYLLARLLNKERARSPHHQTDRPASARHS